jgi:hypothetical protein
LITRRILGEQYRSWSSSLWSFLHSSVISSLLGLNNICMIVLSIPSDLVIFVRVLPTA